MPNDFIWIMFTSILLIEVGLGALALKFPAYRKGIMLFYVIFQIFYLLWRVTSTIPVTKSERTFFGSFLELTKIFSPMWLFFSFICKRKKANKRVVFSSDFVPDVDIFT